MNRDEFYDLPLYFVKHKMTSNLGAYSELISDGCIAFHYEYDLKDGVSPRTFNPDDYKKKSNRDLFRRLERICETGAIIAADYSKYHPVIPAKMLMGVIEKGSEPGDTISFREFRVDDESVGDPNGIGTYKVIQLKYPEVFSYVKYRELQTLQAGKRGNLHRWRKSPEGEIYIKSLYALKLGLIKSLPRSVYALTPSQLEVLCSEYLRYKAPESLRIDYVLSPIGRGRKDIDIDGISGRTLVLAQVSMSVDPNLIERKVENLLGYRKEVSDQAEVQFVYFGPESELNKLGDKYHNLCLISIEEVFEEMEETEIIDYMRGEHL